MMNILKEHIYSLKYLKYRYNLNNYFPKGGHLVMKTKGLVKLLVGLTLAASGAFAVGNNLSHKKAESVDASSISSYSKIYRFTAPAEYWGSTVYVHAWGSGTSSNNTTWPGIDLSSEFSYNESSRKVYTFATNVTDYQYLIFHNNNGWQTDNITIGSNTAWYLDGGNSPGTWTPSNQTYYFYDYTNQFSGNPTVKGKQSNGSLDSGNYIAMTKVANTSQVYSVTLDPAFDQFAIKNGAVSSGDIWINQNRGHTYCNWDPTPGWGDNLNYVKAHDWALQTMHLRDVSTTNNNDTGACRGNSGYYQKAKTDYNSFSSAIKTEISKLGEWNDAKARMSAWATANGETASWSGTTLTISSARTSLLPTTNTENTNAIAIIIIISLVSVTAIGGFFFIRKRKEN